MAIETRQRMITPQEAANLVGVTGATVINWIDREAIPYIELPSPGGKRRKFRIPLDGFLATFKGNFDLEADLVETDGPTQEIEA